MTSRSNAIQFEKRLEFLCFSAITYHIIVFDTRYLVYFSSSCHLSITQGLTFINELATCTMHYALFLAYLNVVIHTLPRANSYCGCSSVRTENGATVLAGMFPPSTFFHQYNF